MHEKGGLITDRLLYCHLTAKEMYLRFQMVI